MHEQMYFIGPRASAPTKIEPFVEPSADPKIESHSEYHQRVSPDGTQVLCEGRLDDAFVTPVGFTRLSQAEAVAQAVAWDKEMPPP